MIYCSVKEGVLQFTYQRNVIASTTKTVLTDAEALEISIQIGRVRHVTCSSSCDFSDEYGWPEHSARPTIQRVLAQGQLIK